MRILVITQYFWPESFRINDLVLGLRDRGHDVVVLTGQPNYPSGSYFTGYSFFKPSIEFWQGIKIYRAPLIARGNGKGIRLIMNYISFAFFSSIRVLSIQEKPDTIFVYEPSPITVGIPAIVAKFKFKVPIYFWVQDIWPHSLTSAGNISNMSVIRIVNSLTKWIYGHCYKILIQSEGFREILSEQKVPSSKIIYFPNWSEEYYIPLAPQKKYSSYFKGTYNLLFAGNIGEAQDFTTLVLAADILKTTLPTLHWVILGEGRMKSEMEELIRQLDLESSFRFLGAFPPEEMPLFFSQATALIVSLKKDPIFAITIPSKIQSYLACGKAILTSLDGEGSRIIRDAKAGLVSPAGSPETLANNILKFVALPQVDKEEMGISARDYYEKVFERNMLIAKLVAILEK